MSTNGRSPSQQRRRIIRQQRLARQKIYKETQDAIVNVPNLKKYVYLDVSSSSEPNALKLVSSKLIQPREREEMNRPERLKRMSRAEQVNYRYIASELKSIEIKDYSKSVLVSIFKGQPPPERPESLVGFTHPTDSSKANGTLVPTIESANPQEKPKSRHARVQSLIERGPQLNNGQKINQLLYQFDLEAVSKSRRRRKTLRPLQELSKQRKEMSAWLENDRKSRQQYSSISQPELSNAQKYSMTFDEYVHNKSATKIKARIRKEQERLMKKNSVYRYQLHLMEDLKVSGKAREGILKGFELIRRQMNNLSN